MNPNQSDKITRVENSLPSWTESVTVREQIAGIKGAFGISVTDLGDILKITRQTVYDWMREERQIQSENNERLNTVHFIAKQWNAMSSLPAKKVLRQNLEDGKSILDLLKEDDIQTERIVNALKGVASDRNAENVSRSFYELS